MLQVTLFTMAGPAIMPFYVNRFKSEICKNQGFFFLGHIAQPYSLYVGPKHNVKKGKDRKSVV